MSKALKLFIAAIALMGVVRFALDRLGVPIETVKYFSMTAVIAAASIYFALNTDSHKERLKIAYWLILPYMAIELFALGYTWITGAATIFHTEEYSLGYSIGYHTVGHFIGGLTWEPLSIFLLMELIALPRLLLRWYSSRGTDRSNPRHI